MDTGVAEINIDQIVNTVVKELLAKQPVAVPAAAPAAPAPKPQPIHIPGQTDRVKRVAVGCDHSAVKGKNIIKRYLDTLG